MTREVEVFAETAPFFVSKCNPVDNILKLCNVLVQVLFVTNKMKLDICYSKLGKRDDSRVANDLVLKIFGGTT